MAATRPVALDRQLQVGPALLRLAVRGGPGAPDLLRAELDRLGGPFTVLAGPDVPASALRPLLPGAPVVRTAGAASLAEVQRLAERLAAAGFRPGGVLVAVGDGLVGESAGVLAALLHGGSRLVHVPTTLGALCGPALSLRHAVGDGAFGVWHTPELVLADLDAVARADVASGLAEVARHVLAVCPAGYREVAALLRPEPRYAPRELAALVALCADARAAVVAYDPQERGPGLALGYGRTAGRALRRLAGPVLGEGAADGLGLLVAARAAVGLGLLDRADEHAHRDLLARAGLPLTLPAHLPVDPGAFAAAVRTGHPGTVLLAGLGRPHCRDGTLLADVDAGTLAAALDAIRPAGTVPPQPGPGRRTRRRGAPALPPTARRTP
ncbi:hypothetical protein ACGFX4_31980 [Kitasatospora sp. NPDC048365]|uniref:3-dehydroquinate synthase family protein n=1 Tax=Kitasatospora sp. NPDC048365 TaxID=3364050 RepID=UPI0037192470